MWASHFTGLFDAALEDPLVHVLEHALYLGSALLFWWPVVGVDPAPRRLSHPIRVGYLIVGMPFSSFLGLAIFSATSVLYTHYATLARDWGQPPLEDQQWAGGLMWFVGDLVFFLAVVFAVGRLASCGGRRGPSSRLHPRPPAARPAPRRGLTSDGRVRAARRRRRAPGSPSGSPGDSGGSAS